AKEFDAVVVSTCEHTHAVATLAALQLGKHVYCEKPLTHNIWEARVIREAAAKTKLATQMGTQNHATDNFRRVVELVQSGAAGPRGPRLGVAGVGPPVGRGREEVRGPQGRRGPDGRRHRSAERVGRAAVGPELGPLARAGAGAAVPPGLCSGAEVVPVVGFRQ